MKIPGIASPAELIQTPEAKERRVTRDRRLNEELDREIRATYERIFAGTSSPDEESEIP
ncbi:MAG: hypothetical protein WD874_00020 [Parcubacteria group bacterium]